MESNLKYWKQHWENQSKKDNEINVSGWGSKQISEYLHDINDVCKKLQLRREHCLLNIGCGNGLMEILLNYWVSEIDSVDFSPGMIQRAKKNNQGENNVSFQVGNILDLSFLGKKYDRILCNSVIQYLNNLAEIKSALKEIAKVSKDEVRILISANPNKAKLNEFLAGYDALDLSEEDKKMKKDANMKSLWTDPREIAEIARSLGFKSEISSMDPRVWQSWYMYDLLLSR